MTVKCAIALLFLLTPAVTTLALAQDGGGEGPPKKPLIVSPMPVPTPTPTGTVQKFFQPASELVSLTR
jgi:hypothetical protein